MRRSQFRTDVPLWRPRQCGQWWSYLWSGFAAAIVMATSLITPAGTAIARDDCPNRTIKIVVPWQPGNSTDVLMLGDAAGVKRSHVPCKGSAPLAVAVVGKNVDSGESALGTEKPHIVAGRLRALGITDEKRGGWPHAG